MVDFAKALAAKRHKAGKELVRVYGTGKHGHAHFSPSSSAGWLNCNAYVLANATKSDIAGYDAAYGTVAHGIASKWLEAIRDMGKTAAEAVPQSYIGVTVTEREFEVLCDETMIGYIRQYIDWCEEVELEGDVFIEQRVDYSEYMPIPKQGGTADHFVCAPYVLYITDLKMGIGVHVFVERNSQAMLYALGVYLEWNWIYSFKRIVIRICQPRLGYFGVWECTVDELLAFAEEARVAADAGWSKNASRSPSTKTCQWCADVGCPARSALLEDLADDAFDDSDVIEGEVLKDYDTDSMENHVIAAGMGWTDDPVFTRRSETKLLVWRYQHRKMFTKWFNDIGTELLYRAQAGEKVPGWKVGAGRRSFSWRNQQAAAKALIELGLAKGQVYITEVTSVSKAKDALRAKGFKPKAIADLFYGVEDADETPMVTEMPGRPTLVPEDDDRDDLGDEVDEAFGD